MTQRERDAARLDVFGDPLPGLALSRCGTVRMWHPPDRDAYPRDVRAASFSPDARRLATASGGAARVWDLEDGREVAVLPSRWGHVWAVLYLSATRILTAGDDRALRLWDADSGEELRRWSLECEGLGRMALSPDGRTLLVGTWKPTGFAVFDMGTGEQSHWVQPEGSIGGASVLSFSPDGSQVVLLERFYEDFRLCVFDSATWTLQWTMARIFLSSGGGWASFSPDGRRVRYLNDVKAWYWRTGVYEHDARTGGLLDIVFHPSGGMWLPLPDGREARARDARLVICRDGEPERWANLPIPFVGWVCEPVVAPGGRWATFTGNSSAVVLVDIEAGKVRPERAHRSGVSSLTFSRDGTKLLTCSEDGTLRTWERGSGRQAERVTLKQWSGRDLRLSAGRALQEARSGGTGMLIRDVFTGAEVNIKVRGRSSTVWSDDHSVVAALADHGVKGELTIHVHDARTGARLWRMPISASRPACALSRTGRLLVTSMWAEEPAPGHTELQVWNLRRFGAPRLVLPIPASELMGKYSLPKAGFSPDDARLVYLDERGAAVLVDLACPERRIRLDAGSPIATFTFSGDGTRVATGEWTGGVKVWSLEGRLLGTLDGHRAYVSALAFSADGNFLASASADTTALIWHRSAWER